jgi:hypothetical protein
MIVQHQDKGVVVRIEVIGVTVGPEEKESVSTMALWLIGFLCGSRTLTTMARGTFNNGIRKEFLDMATRTKGLWQTLLERKF